MSALLQARDVELGYGEIVVCESMSFEIHAGEIVALIGANGAGKTTTMAAVAGSLIPRSGQFLFEGSDITQDPSHVRSRLGITLVPEGRRVFPFLSVEENLEMGGFNHRKDRKRLRTLQNEVYDLFPVLAERRSQGAGTLSGGEQQMLAIGRGYMSSPRLLCLDEPSLGLAPLIVQEIFETIIDINRRGTTVLLVEQNAQYALRTASRGYVLQTGQIVFSGLTDELRNNKRVQEAYLGRGVELGVADE